MDKYKLSEEKAAEWSVTPQHVQSLCRRGKVEGAVKRAGIWFIPNDAPNPTKNIKTDAMPFQFDGTKGKIFECAIELFASDGFDNVSVQDIAAAVGIRQSAVYNHFKSKDEILDMIYGFYSHYYRISQPSLDDLEPILRDGSLYDILAFTRYKFSDDIVQKILNATKIVFQRKFTDERARKLAKQMTMDEGISFVEAIFNRAVECGRLAPLDVHAMAVFVNGAAVFTLHSWVIDPSPENAAAAWDDEHKLFEYATKLLTDLRPPKSNETQEL